MARSGARGDLPRGRNAILTTDPILRELFAIMHRQKLKAANVAGAIGITRQAFSRWKKGVATPHVDLVQAFANVLGYRLTIEKIEPAK